MSHIDTEHGQPDLEPSSDTVNSSIDQLGSAAKKLQQQEAGAIRTDAAKRIGKLIRSN